MGRFQPDWPKIAESESVEKCVDAVAERNGELVLVRRYTEPEGVSLPGGRAEEDESAYEAIKREVEEETGLDFEPKRLLGVYDDPTRDPRGRKVSAVYVGEAYGTLGNSERNTDPLTHEGSSWISLDEDLVFDHFQILEDALEEGGGLSYD